MPQVSRSPRSYYFDLWNVAGTVTQLKSISASPQAQLCTTVRAAKTQIEVESVARSARETRTTAS